MKYQRWMKKKKKFSLIQIKNQVLTQLIKYLYINILQYKKEISRLNIIKVSRINELITGKQHEVEELANEIEVNVDDILYNNPTIEKSKENNNLIELFDEYCRILDILNDKKTRMAPIIKGIEKYISLLKDKDEYDEITTDTSRYTSRKSPAKY